MIDEALIKSVRQSMEGMPGLAEHLEMLAGVARALAEAERVWLADAEGSAARVHCLQVRLFFERALLVVRSAMAEAARQ